MDWLQNGLTQFRTLPVREKVPVLLCGRSILHHLTPGEFETIPDEPALLEQVEAVSKKIGTLWVDKWLAAISDVVSGIVITPSGFPGRVTFPIFPFRTANSEVVRRLQCIDRDNLSPKTFARFFGLFRKLPEALRPRVLFVSEDRMEAATFFDNIGDLVDIYEVFPDRLARLRSADSNGRHTDYFDYLASGSFTVTSHQSIDLPEPLQDASEIRRRVIRSYHICMAQQRDSAAFSAPASKNVKDLLASIDRCILNSDKHNEDFLISAKIQALLLKIVIDDDDGESLYQALSLSKAVENLTYEQKCLRFSNQIAGVSSYALASLQQSASAISEICEREPYQHLHRLEYFAVMQNIFITRLFNRRNLIDAGEAANCLEFAFDQFRYFDELAMLANSVALSFLTVGNTNEADRYFQSACSYGADRLTHLNIRINQLIARHLGGEKASDEALSAIFDEYETLPFGGDSEYHAAMAFGNLWLLANDKVLRQRIVRAASKRGFISANEGGRAIIPSLRRRGFLFMKELSFVGPLAALMDRSGFMPAFHFNWSTPVAELSPR